MATLRVVGLATARGAEGANASEDVANRQMAERMAMMLFIVVGYDLEKDAEEYGRLGAVVGGMKTGAAH